MKECCSKPQVKDLTQGLGEDRHWYCTRCRSHQFKGKQYTRTEWEKMVNSYDCWEPAKCSKI